MTEYLLHFRIPNHKIEHHIWISHSYIIEDFINEIKPIWKIENYELFCLETKSILNKRKSWLENQVVSGDHIFMI